MRPFGMSAVFSVILLASNVSGPAAEPTASAPLGAAEEWLKLMDEQKYGESWGAAGELLQETLGKAQWVQAAELIRKPLGAVTGRKLKSETPKSSIPGGPEGEYLVIQYETSFLARSTAVETVILQRQAGGWHVASYFVK
jgi:hypothetical protein